VRFAICCCYCFAGRVAGQAACTAKELKELVSMPSIAVHAQPSQLVVSEADQAQMKAVRLKRRIFELISNVSNSSALAHMQPQTYATILYGVSDAVQLQLNPTW
jgi:hypothetical protein